MVSPADLAARARSLLFVPGDRPDRFAKATSSAADLVLLDLEDAVAPAGKDEAREHVARALASGHPYGVRINGSGTPWMAEDLEVVARQPCVVMVAKGESADLLAALATRLSPGSAVIPLLETARGILSAPAIASACGIARLALGTFDLAAELLVAPDDREAMAFARGQLVLASALAELPGPIDGVTGNLRDQAKLRDDLQHARRVGFRGKLCIHPSQVPLVTEMLRPTPAQVAWAQGLLASQEGAGAPGASVAAVDGELVDKPVVERARRILDQL